jgi:hypothetical protein
MACSALLCPPGQRMHSAMVSTLCRTTYTMPPYCRNIRPRVVDKAESVRHIRRPSSCPLINSSSAPARYLSCVLACWHAACCETKTGEPILAATSVWLSRLPDPSWPARLLCTYALRTDDGSTEQDTVSGGRASERVRLWVTHTHTYCPSRQLMCRQHASWLGSGD